MDYLDSAEKAELQRRKEQDPLTDVVLNQVDDILASRAFARAHQSTRDFLSFVMAWKLLERDAEIKETTVAMRVFRKPADYNPAADATVREAARGLREKLARYYENEGQDDPIEISIPKFTYVPVIEDRRLSIAVSLLENWNPNEEQKYLCLTASDEIAHRLRHAGPIQVARVTTRESDTSRYLVLGSLTCPGDRVRLNISLSDVRASVIIFCEHFEGRRDAILQLAGEVAGRIVAALRSKNVPSPKRESNVVTQAARSAEKRKTRSL
jgi:TolB-like protein